MKLHPLSVPYRAVRTLVNLAGAGIVLLLAAPALLQSALAVAVTGAVAIGVILAVVGWQYAYYQRFEYELTEDTVDIDRGVLSRRSREIPYERVQNVAIDRNVIERAIGLAELRLETAGGSGAEVHLQYVGAEEARRLQNEIGKRSRRGSSRPASTESGAGEGAVPTGATDETAGDRTGAVDGVRADDTGEPTNALEPEPLFHLTSRELGVLGLVSLDARYLPLVLFGLSALPGSFSAGGRGSLAAVAAVVAGLLLLTLIAAAISAAYSVTNYYGFRLVRLGDELRYERGLLQRYSGTIPLRKVQALTISENPLARRLGYASLDLETAGFSPGESGGSQAAIPIALRDRVVSLATEIEPVELPEFERPPTRSRIRYVVRYTLLVAIAVAIGFVAARLGLWIGPWWWPALFVLLVPPAAHLKWRNLGYALTEDHVVTRHGFWRRTTKIVPYHRVQTVADSQTIFQRRRSLATLHVDVAGSRSLVSDDSKAVDIDAERAAALRETIAERLLDAVAEHGTGEADRLAPASLEADADRSAQEELPGGPGDPSTSLGE